MNDPSELVPIEDALIKQRTSERKSIYWLSEYRPMGGMTEGK